MTAYEAIEELHARCAVFTSPETASRLLDGIGWTKEADLTSATLLEPCAGEGAILVEAAGRLLAAFRARGLPIAVETMTRRLVAFELHESTAVVARRALVDLLVREGMDFSAAASVAHRWVTVADFLLQRPRSATHVVANPPYVRWCKLPSTLAATYRKALRPLATRGDLAVAFLDRMLDWLEPEGELVALVSDRWMYAQYGAEFVVDCARRGWAIEVLEERPERPFVRLVGAYSSIVKMRSTRGAKLSSTAPRAAARLLHSRLAERHGTLDDAGCRVRVGPALGCGDAFLVSAGDGSFLEEHVLRRLVTRANLVGGRAVPDAMQVAVPWSADGRLLSLEEVPGFAQWIAPRREKLACRSCIKEERNWWRTIDTIGVDWATAPKLLVPELCRDPMAYLDTTDALPAHSIYAIWPGEWPAETLQRVLNAGLLKLTAEAEAPALKQGWFRLYRRFLIRTPLPKWGELSGEIRSGLSSDDETAFATTFAELFAFRPGDPFNEKFTEQVR